MVAYKKRAAVTKTCSFFLTPILRSWMSGELPAIIDKRSVSGVRRASIAKRVVAKYDVGEELVDGELERSATSARDTSSLATSAEKNTRIRSKI